MFHQALTVAQALPTNFSGSCSNNGCRLYLHFCRHVSRPSSPSFLCASKTERERERGGGRGRGERKRGDANLIICLFSLSLSLSSDVVEGKIRFFVRLSLPHWLPDTEEEEEEEEEEDIFFFFFFWNSSGVRARQKWRRGRVATATTTGGWTWGRRRSRQTTVSYW